MKGCSRKSSDIRYRGPCRIRRRRTLNERLLPKEQRPRYRMRPQKPQDAPPLNERLLPKEQRRLPGLVLPRLVATLNERLLPKEQRRWALSLSVMVAIPQ